MPIKKDVRYRVQSLGRALDLLDLIEKQGKYGARLTDLANALCISKASTHAMLQTLLSRDYVSLYESGAGKHYRLGLALAHLGDQAINNISLVDIAVPILRDLSAEVQCTSRVAILDDGFAVVIGRVDSPGAVRFDAALGRREFPHSTAVGKALLATLPPNKAREIVERIGLPPQTSHTITDIDMLFTDLELIAKRGYAIDNEEDSEGVFCMGTCVFDMSGKAAGAISFSSIKHASSNSRQDKNIVTLIKYADLISSRLGGQQGNLAWSQFQKTTQN